jgi:L-iditol 2-dehydrogenase
MRFAATPPHDGTLSTYYSLPEECCFQLPPHISFEEGALVEPLAVAVHCCRLANIKPGSALLVFGAGPVGLLCCAVGRAFGASSVTVADIVESRLDFAKKYAATSTYLMGVSSVDLDGDLMKLRQCIPLDPDTVIEATGAPPCVTLGISALKRGGTFVQAGLGNPRIDFPIGLICDKEITLKGSFRYGPGDYELAIELLRSKKVGVKELITHRFDFIEAERAFETVKKREGIKSIIRGPDVSVGLSESVVDGLMRRGRL